MAYIFKDLGNSKYGKQGIIPYRLFYQPNKIIKNLEFAMSNSVSYNLKTLVLLKGFLTLINKIKIIYKKKIATCYLFFYTSNV